MQGLARPKPRELPREARTVPWPSPSSLATPSPWPFLWPWPLCWHSTSWQRDCSSVVVVVGRCKKKRERERENNYKSITIHMVLTCNDCWETTFQNHHQHEKNCKNKKEWCGLFLQRSKQSLFCYWTDCETIVIVAVVAWPSCFMWYVERGRVYHA